MKRIPDGVASDTSGRWTTYWPPAATNTAARTKYPNVDIVDRRLTHRLILSFQYNVNIIIIIIIEKSIKRLSLLTSHDSLCLLKNSIAMPKLLYTLRTSPCAGNPLLHEFNNVLRTGLETILNVQLSDLQWMQASLPMGGFGVRSVCSLASSAFLASAAATLPLQDEIL